MFEWLQSQHPGKFDNSLLRSFQRGVKRWQATEGEAKEVFFSQVHPPGRLCASDFTHMTSLEVTVGGQAFDHLVYHFVLTYSNWEWITICFFRELREPQRRASKRGLGIGRRARAAPHRSHEFGCEQRIEREGFMSRYTALLGYYKMAMEKIQPREANENGDVEQSHRRFKEGVEQALLMRGHRGLRES